MNVCFRKKQLEQRILYFIFFTELVAQRSHLGVLVERRRVGRVSVCGKFAAVNAGKISATSIDRHRARLRRTGTCLMVDVILLILLEIDHLVVFVLLGELRIANDQVVFGYFIDVFAYI